MHGEWRRRRESLGGEERGRPESPRRRDWRRSGECEAREEEPAEAMEVRLECQETGLSWTVRRGKGSQSESHAEDEAEREREQPQGEAMDVM